MKAGRYHETDTIEISGVQCTKENPCKIRTVPGDENKVYLDGTVTIGNNGWELYKENIYKTKVD